MPRTHSLLAPVLGALLAVGCGGGDEAPPLELASPSAACDQAFADAGEAGERAGPESPRSPDIDALQETLEACASADEWLTAARGHPGALPLELDRESALDLLCDRDGEAGVCQDWRSSGSGAGRGDAPPSPSPSG